MLTTLVISFWSYISFSEKIPMHDVDICAIKRDIRLLDVSNCCSERLRGLSSFSYCWLEQDLWATRRPGHSLSEGVEGVKDSERLVGGFSDIIWDPHSCAFSHPRLHSKPQYYSQEAPTYEWYGPSRAPTKVEESVGSIEVRMISVSDGNVPVVVLQSAPSASCFYILFYISFI